MVDIHVASRFKRSYQKIPKSIKVDFVLKIELFQKQPFHQKLKTHKLAGTLNSCYAFCLRDGYRVLFKFEDTNVVLLVNIGSHDQYSQWGRE